tara:strand:+ start:12298 stop:13410 length:1113 start_codon:yes stop_codon:yes gene_type:complete
MPLFNRRGATATGLTYNFEDSAVSASAGSVFTFSSAAIGTAATDRQVIVGVGSIAGTVGTISGVTVGGIAAVQAVHSGEGSMSNVDIWAAPVPSGTSADVIITHGSSKSRCGIGVWSMYGAAACPFNTAGSITDPPSAALTIPTGGVGFGYCQTYGSTATYTWTNLTEAFDETVGGNGTHTGASSDVDGTPTITCTPSSTTSEEGMALASWAPFSPPGTAYRYFRLNITANNGHARGGSIGELEIFANTCEFPAANMSSNTAPSPLVASASNSEVGNIEYKAFNGSASGWYTQTSAGVPQWLQIDLGSGNGIAPTSFSITENSENPSTAAPKDFTLSGSDDGNFSGEETVLKTVTGQTSWSDQEVRTYTI